jgi:proline iminopeptidase
MPEATVNGVRLFYDEEGSGPPCLLMHGGLGVDHNYLRGLTALADVLHLIYYDHRCNGISEDAPLETLTMPQLADDADGLRAHLGIESSIVFGHSYGGFIALEYVLRHPDRVDRLILSDAAPAGDYAEEIGAAVARRQLPADVLEKINSTPSATNEEFMTWFEAAAPLYMYKNPQLLVDGLATTVPNAATAARSMQLWAEWSVADRLSEIDVPTLILVGRHDHITPPSQSERLAQAITGAELVVFEESAHFPWLEEPDAYFGTVRDWLARTA